MYLVICRDILFAGQALWVKPAGFYAGVYAAEDVRRQPVADDDGLIALKAPMRENTISKNFFVGLSAPSRSDMKISLKYGAMPALSRRLSCTEAVPFETI